MSFKLAIFVPTFREPDHVVAFLDCFDKSFCNQDIALVFCNSNPGDASSEIIARASAHNTGICEVQCSEDMYWAAALNNGINLWCRDNKARYVGILNVDVTFDEWFLNAAISLMDLEPDDLFLMGSLATAEGICLSSGVVVLSWWLTLNMHPLNGETVESAVDLKRISVDFLSGRAMFFGAEILENLDEVFRSNSLPQYGADYEFSRRVNDAFNCRVFIEPKLIVYADVKNTGFSVYSTKASVWARLRSIFSIKNPSNPIYRSRFVMLSYPRLARYVAVVLYMAKSLVEVILGGEILKKLDAFNQSSLGSKNHGKN